MEPASPARLYASVAGALLVVIGVLGFFYTASFGAPGSVEKVFGVLPTNGWLNLLHVATGALGLLAAGAASRRYSLALGVFYTALAIWGWTLGGADAILGFLPAASGDEALHLALGLLGLAAAAGTPNEKPQRRRRRSKPRAKVARQRA
jgi:hypothetical protein